MTTTLGPATPHATVPAATRGRLARWRNPRFLLGALLVTGSTVLGAQVLAASDDTVAVWAVTADLPAGAEIGVDQLERREVRFPDKSTADRYVAAADELPAGVTLDRPVEGGELLPRAAVSQEAPADLVEVPLGVLADDLPATVRQGSVVDVWVATEVPGAAESRAGSPKAAVPVLSDVVVVAVPKADAGFAPQTTRQVIVGVPRDSVGRLGEALGAIADGRVVIARKG